MCEFVFHLLCVFFFFHQQPRLYKGETEEMRDNVCMDEKNTKYSQPY